MVQGVHYKRVKYKAERNLFKKPKLERTLIFILLGLFFFVLLLFLFNKTNVGSSGYAVLEEQEENKTAIIRTVIGITKAEKLDENRQFISDILGEVRGLDNVWSETISNGEYVRVSFEENLTSSNDITLYPRVVSGNPRIEVYEVNTDIKIAEFKSLSSNEYNKAFLTGLQGSQDSFDLRVLDGSLEFESIIGKSRGGK